MKKMKIRVPKGVRYINQWEGFTLPDHPCIIDKQITGCGFTEYCLTNKDNVILCSPRKILLENKEEQHSGDVLYAKSGLDTFVNFEKDLTTGTKRPDKDKEKEMSNEEIKDIITKFKNSIQQYYQTCVMNNKPCKILVTYDSFRHVKSALGDQISNFYVVIDEFQSIFTDAKFKSTTEIEFMSRLKDIRKLSFISATPYMDKYLEMLDEFKDLPFYQLDWETEDSSRVSIPKLNIHSCSRSIIPSACEVIQKYKDGVFESTSIYENGEIKNIESREAVLYVNSVKNICDIISKCCLTLDNTNVLCANTDENEGKLRKAFGFTKTTLKDKYGIESCIGKVPTKDQPRKMFTICMRTVYLGADFYSDNARTFIFSDANIDSLTVDITIDLPQILGRQRLEENPWKNRAELYYKVLNKDKGITQEDFDTLRLDKKRKTEKLLNAYSEVSSENKHELAEAYQNLAKTFNYKDNYIAVNTHDGSDLIPTFNNLVMINDMRSYEIQQIDYKDRFRVFNALGEKIKNNSLIQKILEEFNSINGFNNKMKYLYSLHMDEDIAKCVLNNIYDTNYAKYYWTIPANRAGTLAYIQKNLEKEFENINREKSDNVENRVKEKVIQTFQINLKYTKSDIKETLRSIYESLNYNKTPKASDLENYFELKDCKLTNSSGKQDHGFKIIKIKD
jgi:hypothetical protein